MESNLSVVWNYECIRMQIFWYGFKFNILIRHCTWKGKISSGCTLPVTQIRLLTSGYRQKKWLRQDWQIKNDYTIKTPTTMSEPLWITEHTKQLKLSQMSCSIISCHTRRNNDLAFIERGEFNIALHSHNMLSKSFADVVLYPLMMCISLEILQHQGFASNNII